MGLFIANKKGEVTLPSSTKRSSSNHGLTIVYTKHLKIATITDNSTILGDKIV